MLKVNHNLIEVTNDHSQSNPKSKTYHMFLVRSQHKGKKYILVDQAEPTQGIS